MKQGFVLIDLMIGTAIAAVIGVFLMSSFYQTNRFYVAVDQSADLYSQVSLLQYQFGRDIEGAFIPDTKVVKKSDKEKEVVLGTEKEKNKEQKNKEESKDQKKDEKEIEKLFYGVNKNNNLDFLTFITNNPLQVYWSSKFGRAKPRIARIVYSLESDKNIKGSYILYRQEGLELELSAYKTEGENKINKHEIAHGIKSFNIEYEVVQEKKEKEDKKQDNKELDKKKKDETKKSELEYIILKQWTEKKEEKVDSEKDKKELPLTPQNVIINVEFSGIGKKEGSKFKFLYNIMGLPKMPKKKSTKNTNNSSEKSNKDISKNNNKKISQRFKTKPKIHNVFV